MMEKLAQPCGVRGARLPPFTIFTITYKVAVYAPAERADKLPLFHLHPYMYSVGAINFTNFWMSVFVYS
jgi:hypothetical protein